MLSNNPCINKDELDFNTHLIAADNGDMDAQYWVGCCYANGIGIEKDEKKAFEYTKKSAEQGHARAQYNLGIQYLEEIGTEKDINKGFEYLMKSSDQGYARAQCMLGFRYSDGKNIKKDLNKAFDYFKQAADQGYADGLFYLGKCYLFGYGVKPEERAALYYFREAAKQDHAQSKHWIENFSTKPNGILDAAENSKECYMPRQFPRLINQAGPYCGSAAFAGGINYAGILDYTLYASNYEKNEAGNIQDKNTADIVVEQLNRTRFPSDGPQFSVQSFVDLSELYNIKDFEAVTLPEDCTEEQYRETVIEAIRNNYTLILACDHQDHMPKPNEGKSTHWALGFGYWREEKGDYKIAVTHHGLYCKWSFHDLYESNKQLPENNPLLEKGTLKDFRFSFFKIKTKERNKYSVINHAEVSLNDELTKRVSI